MKSPEVTFVEDLLVLRVRDLSPSLRERLPYGSEDDMVLTRPGSRAPSCLVSARFARLIDALRTPTTLGQAALSVSSDNASAIDLVKQFAHTFGRLQRRGWLVPVDRLERSRLTPVCVVGQILAGDWKVVRVVRVLDDTDVYELASPDGRRAAAKLDRKGPGSMVHQALVREKAVLDHLRGVMAPLSLGESTIDEKPMLLIEWLPGRNISEYAAGLATAGRLQLCVQLAEAYANLHELGVIHGDVADHNCLVDEGGVVRLIDFGLARLNDTILPPAPSPGLICDPEKAAEVLAGRKPPLINAAAEQYRVAQLIYFLITRRHPIDFAPDRETMLRQVIEEPPRPLGACGLRDMDAISEILLRAMAKNPAQRFESMRRFFAALEDAVETRAAATSFRSKPERPQGAEQELLSLILDSEPDPTSDLPQASIFYGLAGKALGILTTSMIRQDPELLAAADRLALMAKECADQPTAFHSPRLGLTPELFGDDSIFFGRAGIHYARAQTCAAMNDQVGLADAIHGLISSFNGRRNSVELTMGTAGGLWACGRLLGVTDHAVLASFAADLDLSLANALSGLAPITEAPEIPLMGMAHGWAGILHARLLCPAASG